MIINKERNNMKNKHVFLSITERCNLNCIYCFEKSKRPESMSIETAMKYINEVMNSDDCDMVTIDFMGGEPFVEFQKIKTICEMVWSKEWDKKYTFYAATNGTLVHGEIKDWLEEHHEQFICALSLDGIKAAHDVNRSNSFDKIDVDFFVRMWPKVRSKTVCSKASLSMLAESLKYIYEVGFPDIDLKLAYAFDWSDPNEMEELKKQFGNLVDFYVEHPEYKVASLLNVDVNEVNYPGKKIKKWCTVGGDTLSVDMKGDKYPCRYFQDLVRNGKISYEDMWKVDYENIQDTLSGKCVDCLIRDVCRTCYAYNLDECGDFGKKNYYSCVMSRISAYSSAMIHIKKKEVLGDKYEISEETLENAKKIVEAYESGKWHI